MHGGFVLVPSGFVLVCCGFVLVSGDFVPVYAVWSQYVAGTLNSALSQDLPCHMSIVMFSQI